MIILASKFVMEGWIRAKLTHPQSTSYGDPHQFYLDNHAKFDFGDENEPTRIKFLDFPAEEENVHFAVTSGYHEIGIRFTVVSRRNDTEDRLSIFESSLCRAIRGYQKFKKHFLDKICPKSLETQFDWQSLLICLYGYSNGLDVRQQNSLLRKIRSALKKFTPHVEFMVTAEKVKDYSDKEIRMITIGELEEQSRFDFDSILVAWDEIYLVVDHHLFATQFFLEDPTQSLAEVAKWGCISSLHLLDLHYEIKAFDDNITKVRTSLNKMSKKAVPTGLSSQREKMFDLGKSRLIIEDELREFANLANKIYEGIRKSKHSTRIFSLLNAVESLPHSLYQAYGILTMVKLGRLPGFGRVLGTLDLELKMLEMKMKKVEMYITGGLLVVLLIVSLVSVYLAPIAFGHVADVLQILTFTVAIVLLAIRLWPRRLSY